MPEAARVHDSIGHTSAMSGLVYGIGAGLVLAAATIFVVGTGGLGAVALGAGIAAAGAGGGLAGEYIGEAMTSSSGNIISGSPNVKIGRQPAARAETDLGNCRKDGPSPIPIAEGSATVLINGKPAARKGDHLACGGVIISGCGTVIIGGGTARVLAVEAEVPPWVNYTLWGVLIAGTGIAFSGAVAAVGWGAALGGLGGGFVGGAAFGWVGGKIGAAIGKAEGNEELGKRIGEVGGGVVGSMFGGGLGGRLGGKFFSTPPPEEPTAFPGLIRGGGNTNTHADRVMQGLKDASVRQGRSATVIEHEDGSVSVGLSGQDPKRAGETPRVVDSMNNSYPNDTYRTSNRPVDTTLLDDPDPGVVSNEKGVCSEAQAAQAAGENPSPPKYYQTVFPAGKPNNYPTADPPTPAGNQPMAPCQTCQANADNYITAASAGSGGQPVGTVPETQGGGKIQGGTTLSTPVVAAASSATNDDSDTTADPPFGGP